MITTKIQTDTATEANWPKCTRDFIHRCNRTILRGENMHLTEMSATQTLPKELVHECFELNGDYINCVGKFNMSIFSYLQPYSFEVVNCSKREKFTSFDKPLSLN